MPSSCDIKVTPALLSQIASEGIRTEAFYRTTHGQIALVGVSGREKVLVLAATPEQAIADAAEKLNGGL